MVDKTAVFSFENRIDLPVYAHDLFTVTQMGEDELRTGSSQLPREALAVLVMLDGKRTVGDVEQRLPQMPPERVRDIVRSLLAATLAREVTMAESGDIGVDFAAFFDATAAAAPSAGTQASASREADKGAPELESKGYYVSFARKAVPPRAATAPKPVVLVIEDDPDMCALVTRLVGGAGFQAETASDGPAIVGRLRRAPAPDLVLLDVGLPGISGFDVLQKIKMHPALKHVPVVMLTADAQRESVARGLMSGADGYVTKPFVHDVLLRAVKTVLGAVA